MTAITHVFNVLRQYVSQRPDMGFRKGMLDCVLEPSSPFDSRRSMRSPKRWFVLSLLLAASAFSCFVYFNKLW
jgi:hypothetical protein